MAAPLVSVVMPVYNGEKYLREAVESILTQTFQDFELIIVDDGSTDGTSKILSQYGKTDPRIHLASNTRNEGQPAALNTGCHLARGKYLALMDADDHSLPERFERQVHFLQVHPEVGVLGTWGEYIDSRGATKGNYSFPTWPALVGWTLIYYSCLRAPSVMMRRQLVEQLGFFRSEARTAEDYDLWARAVFETQIVNLPRVLLQYRIHEESVSSRHSQLQEQVCVTIVRSMIERLLGTRISTGLAADFRQMAIHGASSLGQLEQIEQVALLTQRLYEAYSESHRLTRLEAKDVAVDARGMLFSLGLSASNFSVPKCVPIFFQALTLCPPYLPKSTISVTFMTRGLKTAANTSIKR